MYAMTTKPNNPPQRMMYETAYEEDDELPLSSHPPREWLSRELFAVGHDDRCNDDPQRGGQYKVPD